MKGFTSLRFCFPAEKWVRGRAIDRGEVDIGTQQSQAIPPGLFWRFHMTVHHPTYVKFNLSLTHNALLGVYGRRNIPPTHTQVEMASFVACCSFGRAATDRAHTSFVLSSKLKCAFDFPLFVWLLN